MTTNGAILNLVAKGTQDIVLTKKPNFSFFRSSYRKHTNYVKTYFEDQFQNGSKFGGKSVYNVYPRGDLLSDVILRINLPEIEQPVGVKMKYVNAVGHSIIKNVKLLIGTQIINEYSGEYLDIRSELTTTEGKIQTYNEMVGKLGTNVNSIDFDSHSGPLTLFVPLKFYFTKSLSKALPIFLMRENHQIRIEVEWRPLSEIVINNDLTGTSTIPSNLTLDSSLYLETIFLENFERNLFGSRMKTGMTYLIEQVQLIEKNNIPYQNGLVDIPIRNFNHPVKELIWVIQRNDVDSVDVSGNIYGNDWLNFTTELGTPSDDTIDTFSRLKIKLDNHDRTLDLDANFLRTFIPYKYHTRVSSTYIYTYPFSFQPESWKPSGSLNFSRINNPDILLKFEGLTSTSDERRNIRIYALNYNLLVLRNGLAGLMFLN